VHLAEGLSIWREVGTESDCAGALDSIAQLGVAEGDSRQAVRLMAAGEALRGGLGIHRAPPDKAKMIRTSATARTALGPTAYDTAAAEGRALTMDEAVAYALGEVTWKKLTPVVAERLAAGEGTETRVASEPAPD